MYTKKVYIKNFQKTKIISVSFQNFFLKNDTHIDHVELNFDTGKARVTNSRFQTFPSVIHGNGPSKLYLDHLGNYIANSWSFEEGCISCKEDAYVLADIKVCIYTHI